MKCPNCGNETSIDVYDGSGYSKDVFECSSCSCEWLEDRKIEIIKKGKKLLCE